MALFGFGMRFVPRDPCFVSVAKYLRSSDRIAATKIEIIVSTEPKTRFFPNFSSQIAFFLSFSLYLVLLLLLRSLLLFSFTLRERSEPLANDLILMCSFVCAQSFELLHLSYVFESSKRSESVSLLSLSFIQQNRVRSTAFFVSLAVFNFLSAVTCIHTASGATQNKIVASCERFCWCHCLRRCRHHRHRWLLGKL